MTYEECNYVLVIRQTICFGYKTDKSQLYSVIMYGHSKLFLFPVLAKHAKFGMQESSKFHYSIMLTTTQFNTITDVLYLHVYLQSYVVMVGMQYMFIKVSSRQQQAVDNIHFTFVL